MTKQAPTVLKLIWSMVYAHQQEWVSVSHLSIFSIVHTLLPVVAGSMWNFLCLSFTLYTMAACRLLVHNPHKVCSSFIWHCFGILVVYSITNSKIPSGLYYGHVYSTTCKLHLYGLFPNDQKFSHLAGIVYVIFISWHLS